MWVEPPVGTSAPGKGTQEPRPSHDVAVRKAVPEEGPPNASMLGPALGPPSFQNCEKPTCFHVFPRLRYFFNSSPNGLRHFAKHQLFFLFAGLCESDEIIQMKNTLNKEALLSPNVEFCQCDPLSDRASDLQGRLRCWMCRPLSLAQR